MALCIALLGTRYDAHDTPCYQVDTYCKDYSYDYVLHGVFFIVNNSQQPTVDRLPPNGNFLFTLSFSFHVNLSILIHNFNQRLCRSRYYNIFPIWNTANATIQASAVVYTAVKIAHPQPLVSFLMAMSVARQGKYMSTKSM